MLVSSTDLYFIRSDLPDHPISRGFRWSLFVLKVPGTDTKAYVGFRSAAAAGLIARQSPLLAVVAAEDLTDEYSHDFSGTPVMLFDSIGEVVKFIRDRKAYPAQEHLYTYSVDTGLKKIG